MGEFEIVWELKIELLLSFSLTFFWGSVNNNKLYLFKTGSELAYIFCAILTIFDL